MSALFGGRQFAPHDTDIPVVTALLNLSEFAVPALHVYDTLGREILGSFNRLSLRVRDSTCSLGMRTLDHPAPIFASSNEIFAMLAHMCSRS
jgi:hypothetical protein